jgi:hypothetical protein
LAIFAVQKSARQRLHLTSPPLKPLNPAAMNPPPAASWTELAHFAALPPRVRCHSGPPRWLSLKIKKVGFCHGLI